MNTHAKRLFPWLAATALFAFAGAAWAQSIYKCPHGNTVEYTDHPCAKPGGELIHQADATETIDYLLNTGKTEAAKRYATEHHNEALYEARLAAYQQRQQDTAARNAATAVALQNQAKADKQQRVLDEQRDRAARLEAQNDLLRDQNADYRDQLQQPTVIETPAYGSGLGYGRWPPYYGGGNRGGHGHHDGDHDNQPQQPIYHPCTQLAGGRVQC